MTLDISYIRDSTKRKVLIESEKNRFRENAEKTVEELLKTDEEWKEKSYGLENLRKEVNLISKSISELFSSKRQCGDDAGSPEDLKKKASVLNEKIKQEERVVSDLNSQRKYLLKSLGNPLASDVPIHKSEEHNQVVKKHSVELNLVSGDFKYLDHYEIMRRLNIVNFKKGRQVCGHRGYYLVNYGAMLNRALLNYGVDFLLKKSYELVQPPYFIKRDVMDRCAELGDFSENLYCIPSNREGEHGEDLFLVATSEQPLCALNMNEVKEASDLPLRYCGTSPCFRKEAGAHGKDVQGLFRLHQFEKIEQFCIVEPDKSAEEHEKMLQISESFYQSLGISYRVVNLVSGELNNAATKKYDLEAWFPGCEKYRELVSCSNCTDYQSRALDIKFGYQKSGVTGDKAYVHMLNGTLVASERTMCCLAETYQTLNGMKIPSVLVPYMNGVEFIPYTVL